MALRVLLVSARPEVEEVFLQAPSGTFSLERRSPGVVQPGECARDFGVALIDLQSATDAIALGCVLRTLNKEVEFIPIVSRADERSGIQAVAEGAFDYLLWPAEPADAWKVLRNCLRKLDGENVSTDFKVPPELLPPAPWANAKASGSVPPAKEQPAAAAPPAVVVHEPKPTSLEETNIRPVTAASRASPVPPGSGPAPVAEAQTLQTGPALLEAKPPTLAETVIRPAPMDEPAVAQGEQVDLVPLSMKKRPASRLLAAGGVLLFVLGLAGSWVFAGHNASRTTEATASHSPIQPLAAMSPALPSSTDAQPVVTATAEPTARPVLARIVRPANGSLSVWVDGWANVYVDGQKLGRTAPFVGMPFPSGKHRVTLENPAKGRRDYEVSIAPGQTTVVRGAF
jgi:hypothetical protein